MLLSVIWPDVFSQAGWCRVLNNWSGLFSFELFAFFSLWLCWSRCQIHCYSYDTAFVICCFLPFLYIPSFSTVQNCIPAIWKGMFPHSVPSFSLIQWLDASKDNYTQQYCHVKVFLLSETDFTYTIQKGSLKFFIYILMYLCSDFKVEQRMAVN